MKVRHFRSLFAENKWKLPFLVWGNMERWTHRHGNIEKGRHGDTKRKTEAQAIFLNAFNVCSSCKRKFVICSFVDEETNGSYPFANGLIGLAHL
jgi:hypothetical protein